jgi:arabinogalactan endo-1,4-beta-galactosidase
MGLLIDFHYSDYWADPGKQFTPAAWANLSFPDLVKRMHDWTKESVQKLRDAGAEPDIVQIGNEITTGLMTDHQPDGGGSTRNWNQLASLLNAGISAVEDVDPKILTMLHITLAGDNRGTRNWIDHALSHGVKFDVLGESCYIEFQGQPDGWKTNFNDLAKRYPQLHFVCAEIADEVRSSNDIMHSLPNQQGLGTFIWEPTQNANRQGLFTSLPRRRRQAATQQATVPTPTITPGAVIPAKMGVYDQMVKDYGLKPEMK